MTFKYSQVCLKVRNEHENANFILHLRIKSLLNEKNRLELNGIPTYDVP